MSVWHGIRKQEKCPSLEEPRGTFYKKWSAGQIVKITRLISISNFQKSLEIFEKKSADKILSNEDIKVKVHCPKQDRGNSGYAYKFMQICA